MTTIPKDEFVAWLEAKKLSWEPENGYIDFIAEDAEDRFWIIPERGARIVYFLTVILNTLDPWEYLTVCKQGCTGWYDDDEGIIHQVRNQIASLSEVPKDFQGALRFTKDEQTPLTTLLFNQLLFGWCMWDDVYIVPDHARQIVTTSHHDVVHVTFKDPKRVSEYVGKMKKAEFPLPTEVPDGTFKIPHWMKKK